MYKAIYKKLGDKMDVAGAKKDKYKIYVYVTLTIDEEGNVIAREWSTPDEEDDLFYDKWDVIKFVNSAIDDFEKFKPCKAYNRIVEDEVLINFYIDFAKL